MSWRAVGRVGSTKSIVWSIKSRPKRCESSPAVIITEPSHAMPTLCIPFLGDADRPEFREARACLARWGSVVEFADADTAAAALAEDRFLPDVMVVAQTSPGQFSHAAIDRLRRLAPLARVLGLMGSWCEGEMRSGVPLAGDRANLLASVARPLRSAVSPLPRGQSCSWALPITATEEERLLADEDDFPVCQGLIVIHWPAREMADWLSDALHGRGLATIWQRDPPLARFEGATAAIFDGTDLCEEETDLLRRFVEALRPAPVIALVSFPRIEDHNRARSAGASAVLSKPLMVEDLLGEIERCKL